MRSGSVFAGSKVQLRKWFQAYYELPPSKKGIFSVAFAVRIGVSQNTARFMNHRICTILSDNKPDMLDNTVEADETYVGGKNKNRHADKKIENSQGRSAADKTPVVGLVERSGKVKTFVIKNTYAETILKIIADNLVGGSTIVTDAYKSYNDNKTPINIYK